MNRSGFLKLTAGVVLAPYLAKIPGGAPAKAAAIAPAATTITTAPGLLRIGDIVRVATTGEALQITKIDGPIHTVTRGIGRTAPTEIPAGSTALRVASSSYEGEDLGAWRPAEPFAIAA